MGESGADKSVVQGLKRPGAGRCIVADDLFTDWMGTGGAKPPRRSYWRLTAGA